MHGRLLVVDTQIHGPVSCLAVHCMLAAMHASAPPEARIGRLVPIHSSPSLATTILVKHFLALARHIHEHLQHRLRRVTH